MNDENRFCTECGSRLDHDSTFCPVCGTKVSGEYQKPVSNTPSPNQINQSCNSNYPDNKHYGQPGNAPSYQPNYNNYTQPQYPPPRKKGNTALIIIIVVLGILILAAGAYFGLKLLQRDTGTSADPLNTKASGTRTSETKASETKAAVSDEDLTGVWEGTVTLTEAKDLDESSNSQDIIRLLNKSLNAKMEIVPDSKSSGTIMMYLAEDVGEDPSPDGLPLAYEFKNGELKAVRQETGSSFSIGFKLGSKGGIPELKGTMNISAPQSDGKTGSVKGNIDVMRTSRKVTSTESDTRGSTTAGGQETVTSGSGNGGQDGNVSQIIEDPAVYLPLPNVRYTFQSWYADGATSNDDIVVGVIPEFSIITEVDMIEASEPITQHFVYGSDGIYVFPDEEYNTYSSLWLPYGAKAGDSWDEEGITVKIVQLGASCDLGYTVLKDCIVVEVDYTEAEYSYISYVAPGKGIVLMNDKDTGALRMKLLRETPMSEQEANYIVRQYSPNVMAALED